MPDGKALWTAFVDARRSPTDDCTEKEWDDEHRKKQFSLDDEGSISAKVFQFHGTYCTNSYATDAFPAFKLFKNTKSLMVAPLIAGSSCCLGVLALESTNDEVFEDQESAAFTLLAGHATSFVSEAIRLEELTRQKVGHADVDRMRQQLLLLARWDDIRQTAQKALENLGFHRGFFSEVQGDKEPNVVQGKVEWAWGDEAIKRVAEKTTRPFEKYKDDCQVIAARDARSVVIQVPKGHPNVNEEARAIGGLHPFGIFPIIDSHKRARWTVHVERKDAVPIRKYEEELVEKLCLAVADAWEAAHWRNLERLWFDRMMEALNRTLPSPRTAVELLQVFLQFLNKYDVTSRGRVFQVDESDQSCIAHFGAYPQATAMRGFKLNNLSKTSRSVLQALREKKGEPLFVIVRSKDGTSTQKGEFAVITDPDATYMAEFDKTNEWIEAGVYLGDQMLWKVVLDHKGRPNESFTLGEMRLVSQIVRTLSWGLTRLDGEQLRSELCVDGAIRALKRHQLHNGMELIASDIAKGFLRNFEQTLRGERRISWFKPATLIAWLLNKMMSGRLADKLQAARQQAIDGFGKLLRQLDQELGPLGEQRRFNGYSEVFAYVKKFIEPYRGGCTIVYPEWENDGPTFSHDGVALCLILLIVLQNAIEATDTEPNVVQITFDEQEETLSVRDKGRGLPDAVFQEFQRPPKVLDRPRRHGLGLVLARLLALELGWELVPVEKLDRGTEFRLKMKNRPAPAREDGPQ